MRKIILLIILSLFGCGTDVNIIEIIKDQPPDPELYNYPVVNLNL